MSIFGCIWLAHENVEHHVTLIIIAYNHTLIDTPTTFIRSLLPSYGQKENLQHTLPGPGSQGQEAANRKKRKLWKAKEFNILTCTLLEEHNLGRQAENGFKEESYQRVVDTLRNQHHSRDAVQVKSAWRRVCSLSSLARCSLTFSRTKSTRLTTK